MEIRSFLVKACKIAFRKQNHLPFASLPIVSLALDLFFFFWPQILRRFLTVGMVAWCPPLILVFLVCPSIQQMPESQNLYFLNSFGARCLDVFCLQTRRGMCERLGGQKWSVMLLLLPKYIHQQHELGDVGIVCRLSVNIVFRHQLCEGVYQVQILQAR